LRQGKIGLTQVGFDDLVPQSLKLGDLRANPKRVLASDPISAIGEKPGARWHGREAKFCGRGRAGESCLHGGIEPRGERCRSPSLEKCWSDFVAGRLARRTAGQASAPRLFREQVLNGRSKR